MARNFNGTSEYLDHAAAVVTAAPLTMACWFRPDMASADLTLMAALNSAGSNTFRLAARGNDAGDPVSWRVTAGGSLVAADTTTGFSSGTWHHACGVEASSNSRRVYLDGGGKGTNTSSRTPSGINQTRVGFGNSAYMDGRIAEAAIWNAALSDEEVASLARGCCPLKVRPASLVAWWPLAGRFDPEISFVDRTGRYELALFGTSAAEHPRVFGPGGPRLGPGVTVGGHPAARRFEFVPFAAARRRGLGG
jgi:hypothetical protein